MSEIRSVIISKTKRVIIPNTRKVIALGFFDGVHIGHAKLLERIKLRASETGFIPAVLSFDRHPDALIKGESVPLINSASDRAELIERLFGVSSVFFLRFDQALRSLGWREFLDMAVNKYNASHLVAGADFRFGYQGGGDAENLYSYCSENGLGCDIIPQVYSEGIAVSSTFIRDLLTSGEIERANRFLGHPHILTGTVRHGKRLGREIGAPTVNMSFPKGVLIPARGVYCAKAHFGDETRNAVTNIGIKPTVGNNEHITVESHLLDYDGDLYGKRLRLEFFKFLRPEHHFDNLAALSTQIELDVLETRKFFAAEAQF